MLDRFKFRVWDKELKAYYNQGKLKYMPKPMLQSDGLLAYDCDNFERFVIQQCTGLKDKNGKLIFEEDILEWQCCDMDKGDVRRVCKVIQEIKIDDEGMQHSRFLIDVLNSYKDNGDNRTYFPRPEKIKIIGNIYENPELLEVSNED